MRLFGLVDDPRAALHHLVLVRQAIERFGGAKEQIATRLEGGMDAQEDFALDLGREVDEHVATEDDVELAQADVALQQVQRTKLDPTANGRLDRPAPVASGIEVALQSVLR